MKDKVVVLKCESYSEDLIYEKLKRGIELLDLKNIPEKILLKPNMLSARNPNEGVTTHPTLISGLIKIFENKKLIIGDSPANALKPIEEYWENCGYLEISKKYNVELKKFDDFLIIDLNVNGKKCKIPVTKLIKEYKVLNIPKFKTHNLTTLTIGIKNLYGLIPGMTKSILHSKFINPYDFSSFLIEFYKKIEENIFLTVVDAIIIMEGDGPSSGELRKAGYIIIGESPVYVDYFCCLLASINPENIDFIKIYKEKYKLKEPEIIGDNFEVLKNFKLPSTKKYFLIKNKFFSKLLLPISKFFKIIPVINLQKCKKCYSCVNVCPVKSISKNLKFDRKKCILCFCCFEVCPYKAIKIKKSLIAKILT